MNKKIIWGVILTLFLMIFSSSIFSQVTTTTNFSKTVNKSTLDSIWSFSPISWNVSTGIYVPIGKRSEYYFPSPQFAVGFGFKISPKLRLDLGWTPRFLIEKKKPKFTINDTIVTAHTNVSYSAGGWTTYGIFRNKYIFTELISGLQYEQLNFDNPIASNSKDSVLSISTWGATLGMNIWINKFGNKNIGIRLLYNYEPYHKDKVLFSNIGEHSASVSLCFKYPQRDKRYRRFYDEQYLKQDIKEPLILYQRNKTNKFSKLPLDYNYTFKTKDTIYYSKIVSFNKNSLKITRLTQRAETDTIHFTNYKGIIGKDTTIISRRYVVDTITIPNSNITYIERNIFKNKRWLEPFAWGAIGAVLGVVLLPIAAFDKGDEGIKDWLIFESVLITVSIPPIIIGTRTRKYDLQKKWKFETN